MCVAPDDVALAKNEVATAADGTPYGREKTWALLPVESKPPARFVVLDETELNRLAASARAVHCGTPIVAALTNEIELAEGEFVWNIYSKLSLELWLARVDQSRARIFEDPIP